MLKAALVSYILALAACGGDESRLTVAEACEGIGAGYTATELEPAAASGLSPPRPAWLPSSRAAAQPAGVLRSPELTRQSWTPACRLSRPGSAKASRRSSCRSRALRSRERCREGNP
jgi:hypothetical protein